MSRSPMSGWSCATSRASNVPIWHDALGCANKLIGKGLVVFTGCSHAGVINVSKHAVDLGGGLPLYAVIGGFHLADNNAEKLSNSLRDLKEFEPKVLMPGHCTGYKFKFMIEQAMPAVLVPSFCGTTYTL